MKRGLRHHPAFAPAYDATGPVPVIYGSGNCLIRSSVFERIAEPSFDLRFNLLGGGDTDFFWIQQIDVNSDGTVESANLIWDDEDKILYFYYEGDFKCKNGKTGNGAALIGVNGKDNPRQKPAGSGFFAVSLDKDECGAGEAGLWGCRFDPTGNPTVCGVVGLDDKYDDIIILKASSE